MNALDLFAGPGGWDIGARALGLDPLGVEFDDSACLTRDVYGLHTHQGDVSLLDPTAFAPCDLLIASPPCPTFSSAGDQQGTLLVDLVVACARDLFAGHDRRVDAVEAAFAILSPTAKTPERARRDAAMTLLVVEPLRWLLALRPEAAAFEQVPPVLPLWRMFAPLLERIGYRTWYGILNAADYGVPQTRRRAFLIASRVGRALPPTPTHCRGGSFSLTGTLLPWISMAEALGWGMTARPSVTVAAGASRQGGPDPLDGGAGPRATIARERESSRWTQRSGQSVAGVGRAERTDDEPSVTIHGRADLIAFVPEALEERQAHGARGELHEPAPTITASIDNGNLRWTGDSEVILANRRDSAHQIEEHGERPNRSVDEPAPTLTGESYRWPWVVTNPEQLPLLHTNRGQDENGDRQQVDGGRRAPTVSGKAGGQWYWEAPSTTVAGDPRVTARTHHEHGEQGGGATSSEDARNGNYDGRSSIRITIEEAATLQGFPPGYPWQGSRTKQFEQVGNAVPPPLAEAVLKALLDG